MIATSVRFAKEHERRGDLVAEVENTSSGGGMRGVQRQIFREVMRLLEAERYEIYLAHYYMLSSER